MWTRPIHARNFHSVWAFFLTLLGLLPVTVFAQAATKPVPQTETAKSSSEETWNVIQINGDRSGYTRSTVKTIKENDRELIRTELEMYLVMKRFGQKIVLKTVSATTETTEGDLETFFFEMANPPNFSQITKGRKKGDDLYVTQEVAGRKSKRTVKWNPDAKSPAYQDRMLEENPLKPGETRKLTVFSPESLQFSEVELTKAGKQTVTLLDGEEVELNKIITKTKLSGLTVSSTSYLDDEGRTLLTETPMLGLTLAMYRVDEETALEKLAGAELDMGISTLIKVGPMDDPHKADKVIYDIKIPGEDPAEFLVESENQSIEKTDESDRVKLIVKRIEPQSGGNSKAVAAKFSEPSQFLQSDDPAVIKHARDAVGDETDPWKQALLLEKYVHKNLSKKNFSTAMASAAEVAQKLEGDCTEHGVLLAAMARAVGIPARVAAGLVYVPRLESFGGHMWTEVYIDGRWIPLDATLGRGGIGCGHITLTQSALADDGPAPVATLMPMMTALAKIKIKPLEVTPEK